MEGNLSLYELERREETNTKARFYNKERSSSVGKRNHAEIANKIRYDLKITKELQQKFDSIINRNLYTKYKTAPTEEEKEKARQEYLDRKGIHSSFRW